ncbi:MAG: aminopeptidase P family protein [Clostridia bacterium]
MKINEIDSEQFIITNPANLYYFTGYKNADSIILFFNKTAYYFTDSRYFEEVASCIEGYQIKNIEYFWEFLESNSITTLGVEDSLIFSMQTKLQKINCKNLYSITGKISKLRAIKNEEELSKITYAQSITDTTFLELLHYIKLGQTENNLSHILSALLYQNGADELAFDNIVAFGKNTSKPHAHPGNTKLELGMPITFDFGAKYQNYCSDMTRTVFFGKPTDEMVNIYNYVLNAQKLALKNIAVGKSGKDCDKIARDYFKENNLDKYFTHSLGHSLGIDIHENPNFSPKCEDIIQSNMVLSVEPGLYFENKFGIRIEDIIFFDKNIIKNLTNSEKNIIIIE